MLDCIRVPSACITRAALQAVAVDGVVATMRADKLTRLVEGSATTPSRTDSHRTVFVLRPNATAAPPPALSRRAVSAVLDVLSDRAWADHVALVLRKHDGDADGILQPSQLRAAVAELGLPLLEAEIRQVGDGRKQALPQSDCLRMNAFELCRRVPCVSRVYARAALCAECAVPYAARDWARWAASVPRPTHTHTQVGDGRRRSSRDWHGRDRLVRQTAALARR
jgi:hypothetical protein